ncbi:MULTISPECIES: hypothetical protein [unclassified Pseudofrankia]|nr:MULTISPECIES: hypothetical protein [unclassified Pseudofrankia]MDT3444836.1 hypothetical protein [Pseudofrankia sp. BMG5.37]
MAALLLIGLIGLVNGRVPTCARQPLVARPAGPAGQGRYWLRTPSLGG